MERVFGKAKSTTVSNSTISGNTATTDSTDSGAGSVLAGSEIPFKV